MHALPDDIAKYKDTYRDGWDALREKRYRRQIELGLIDKSWPLPPRDPEVPAWESVKNKKWEAERMAVYAAMIDRMDQGIGKILAELRATGAAENTLVMFLSDNGACAEGFARPAVNRPNPPYVPTHSPDGKPIRRGNVPEIVPGPDDTYSTYGRSWAHVSATPFRSYKHWTHEGGIATPFIAHWPAGMKREGRRDGEKERLSNEVAHIIDVAATCLDLAGAKYPTEYAGKKITPLEGRSLKPLFVSSSLLPSFSPSLRPLFWEHEGNRAVRQGKWKRYETPWELYDTEADRTELNDLAEKNPAKAGGAPARAPALPWGSPVRLNLKPNWNEFTVRF